MTQDRLCEGCGKPLPSTIRTHAQYHGSTCRTAAWRARVAEAGPTEDHRTVTIRSRELADALSASVGRTVTALDTGIPADPFDIDRIRVISNALAARAMTAHPEVDWSDSGPSPTITVLELEPSRDVSESPVRVAIEMSARGTEPSRDGSGTGGAASRRASAARPGLPKRMSRKRAMEAVSAAELVKADDWRESNRWLLRSGETVIGAVAPDYIGYKRNGWIGIVHETTVRTERRPTREAASVMLADAWVRQVTAKTRRTVTGS